MKEGDPTGRSSNSMSSKYSKMRRGATWAKPPCKRIKIQSIGCSNRSIHIPKHICRRTIYRFISIKNRFPLPDRSRNPTNLLWLSTKSIRMIHKCPPLGIWRDQVIFQIRGRFATSSLLAPTKLSLKSMRTYSPRTRNSTFSTKNQPKTNQTIKTSSPIPPQTNKNIVTWRSKQSSSTRSTPKAADTKATKFEDSNTASADFTTKTVGCMKATGKKTGWPATANSTINPINLPTRANGKTTSSIAKGSSTTSTHNLWGVSSTTATLMRSSSTGQNIKVTVIIIRVVCLGYEAWKGHTIPSQWRILLGLVSQRLCLRPRHFCISARAEDPRPLAEQSHAMILH